MSAINSEKIEKDQASRPIVAFASILTALLLASQFFLASHSITPTFALETSYDALELDEPVSAGFDLDPSGFLYAPVLQLQNKNLCEAEIGSGFAACGAHVSLSSIRAPPPVLTWS